MSQAIATVSSVASREVEVVNSVQELVDATANPAVKTIAVATDLSEVPDIRLAPGVGLCGQTNIRTALRFAEGIDGICLSSNNVVADLDLTVSNDRCAIWNDESVSSFGTLALRRLKTTGRVRILARGNVRSGHVLVEELDIGSADARAEKDRPHEYGVDVLQGAFTLWNMQIDEKVVITADLIDLSPGRFGAPVLGSGIFVSGAGEIGGRLEVQHLRMKAVYSDGRI
jgi:hypothetical protein